MKKNCKTLLIFLSFKYYNFMRYIEMQTLNKELQEEEKVFLTKVDK